MTDGSSLMAMAMPGASGGADFEGKARDAPGGAVEEGAVGPATAGAFSVFNAGESEPLSTGRGKIEIPLAALPTSFFWTSVASDGGSGASGSLGDRSAGDGCSMAEGQDRELGSGGKRLDATLGDSGSSGSECPTAGSDASMGAIWPAAIPGSAGSSGSECPIEAVGWRIAPWSEEDPPEGDGFAEEDALEGDGFAEGDALEGDGFAEEDALVFKDPDGVAAGAIASVDRCPPPAWTRASRGALGEVLLALDKVEADALEFEATPPASIESGPAKPEAAGATDCGPAEAI